MGGVLGGSLGGVRSAEGRSRRRMAVEKRGGGAPVQTRGGDVLERKDDALDEPGGWMHISRGKARYIGYGIGDVGGGRGRGRGEGLPEDNYDFYSTDRDRQTERIQTAFAREKAHSVRSFVRSFVP